MNIETGLKGRADSTVTPQNTANAIGSGLVPVFATPHMIALMEHAAVEAIQPALGPEESSVGAQISVSHNSATPIGMKVWAEAEVTAVDGRNITFTVTAFDEVGEIGSGTHKRVVLETEKFLNRTQAKLDNR